MMGSSDAEYCLEGKENDHRVGVLSSGAAITGPFRPSDGSQPRFQYIKFNFNLHFHLIIYSFIYMINQSIV